jgi:hypothetical protein
MDFMPDKEFHDLFDRKSRVVDFKGCRTEADVNGKLRQKGNTIRHRASANPLEKLKAASEADRHYRLIPAFGKRVIDEAISNPNGLIALTLKHGRKKALILYKQLKKFGLNRKWRRKRR